MERYKARLVAKGFTRTYGLDYEETFAPLARLPTVRTLIALAALRQWKLFQMDVKNAFLNGDLSEEVYMQPPPGYPHQAGQVCRLRKALYGLKQAPRAWFYKLKHALFEWGFSNSTFDISLFHCRKDGKLLMLLVYVDDILVTENSISFIGKFIVDLFYRFSIKDLGALYFFSWDQSDCHARLIISHSTQIHS